MHTRNTVIMAAVLVLLAGFVYLYEIRGRAEREEAERQAELLVSFEIEDVERVEVATSEGTVTAAKTDGEWSITAPVAVAADGQAIDTLIDRMHEAKHEREITESAEDLAPFGLDEPVARVTLGLAGGGEVALAVGKDTPVGMNAYAASGSSDAVYSTARTLKNDLDKKLFDLRDKTVVQFEQSAVNAIELAGPDLNASLRLEPGSAQDDGQWIAATPFAGRADNDTIDDLLSGLHTAEVAAFIVDAAPSGEQLAEHGLDEPKRTITLRTDAGAAYTLHIGAASEDPEGHYAMREAGDSIFVVETDLLADLPSGTDALRNKQVLTVARENIEAIQVQGAGGATRVERRDADWELTLPRTLEADASSVSRVLSALQDLRAEGFAATSPAAGGEDLVVTLQLAAAEETTTPAPVELRIAGSTQIVPLTEVGDEEAEEIEAVYVTTSQDPTVYLVPAEDVEDLRVDTFDLRAKTIVQFTQPDLTAIDVLAGGVTYSLVKTDEEWGQTAPAALDLEANTVSDLLWDLNYLRMDAVPAEWRAGQAPDLARFGLDAPRFRVTARAGDAVATRIAIGSTAPQDAGEEAGSARVYIMVDDRPAVFEVGVAVADAVEELLEKLAR